MLIYMTYIDMYLGMCIWSAMIFYMLSTETYRQENVSVNNCLYRYFCKLCIFYWQQQEFDNMHIYVCISHIRYDSVIKNLVSKIFNYDIIFHVDVVKTNKKILHRQNQLDSLFPIIIN